MQNIWIRGRTLVPEVFLAPLSVSPAELNGTPSEYNACFLQFFHETCSLTMGACGLIESIFYVSILISHDSGSPSTGALMLI